MPLLLQLELIRLDRGSYVLGGTASIKAKGFMPIDPERAPVSPHLDRFRFGQCLTQHFRALIPGSPRLADSTVGVNEGRSRSSNLIQVNDSQTDRWRIAKRLPTRSASPAPARTRSPSTQDFVGPRRTLAETAAKNPM